MNVLSLFDGMSCGQIALNRAGIEYSQYYASEIKRSPIKITQRNYPQTIQLGDVKNVKAANLPFIGLIIGGSPCQGFSSAGEQLNFNDPRSALFFEYVRILNEIREYNPDVKFLLENVKMKKEWEAIITKTLGVRPLRFNSSLVSAQFRQRLYWTNICVTDLPEDRNITLSQVIEPGYWADRSKSYCLDANYGKGTNFRRYFFCGSRQLVLENGYALPDMTKETANQLMHSDGNRWRKLTPLECERLQTVPEGYTEGVSNGCRYEMLGNGWTVDIIAHIFKYLK